MLDWWSHLLASPGKQVALAESAAQKMLRWGLFAATGRPGRWIALRDAGAARQALRAPAVAAMRPYREWSQAFLLWEQWWQRGHAPACAASRPPRGGGVVRAAPGGWTCARRRTSWPPTPRCCRRRWPAAGRTSLRGAANWWRDAMAVAADGRPKDAEKFAPGQAVAHHAGQGGVPQPADRADPVRAGAPAGAPRAGADRAVVDHEVLHPRPVAAQLDGASTWSSRATRCS